MDTQPESAEPPAREPQPPGRINKAAFKLFGRRKPCGAVPAIFSARSRGEASQPGGTVPALLRSKTHDGLAESGSVLEGGGASPAGEELQVQATRSAVTKSLSFFSLLRRNGRGAEGGRDARDARFPKQRRGLKGLFGSLRWPRRDKALHADWQDKEAPEGRAGGGEGVDLLQETVMLSLEPQASTAPEPLGDAPPGAEGHGGRARERPEDATGQVPGSLLESGEASGAALVPYVSVELSPSRAPGSPAKPRYDGPEAHPFPTAGPIMTVTPAEPPAEPSVDRLCSMFTDVTSLKSFDSLTGCGDIIADAEDEGGGSGSGSGTSSGTGSSSGGGAAGGADGRHVAHEAHEAPEAHKAGAPTGSGASAAQVRAPPSAPSAAPVPLTTAIPAIFRGHMDTPKVQGSGVVAYMGGGEEMASPEEMDDADMQDLWHMLPQSNEAMPPRPKGPCPENRPQVRMLGLSKIPMSDEAGPGGSEEGQGKEPVQEAPSDEGYWDSPTPGPEEEEDEEEEQEQEEEEEEEEESCSPPPRDALPRDSCSGDALYDLYVDPEQSVSLALSDEELNSLCVRGSQLPVSSSAASATTSCSSSSSFRSMKGSTSLPRDSRIPISIKQVPPSHSASQGALTSGPPRAPPPQTELPRTKIPVSKVPVRRTSNNPAGARLPDSHRK